MMRINKDYFSRILFALIVICCSLLGSYFISKSVKPGETTNTINIYTVDAINYSSADEDDMASIISTIKDTVVNITSTSLTATSAGSGVIIGEGENNYYIVTNHHVIDGFVNFEVELQNGEKYQASLVGSDPMTDLAVLSIEAEELPVAQILRNSDSLLVGETVIAIGNPLGKLGGTVSKGIISAKDRDISVDGRTMRLLQTDSAVNSGNSGGGLFNASGILIGIVNAKASSVGVEGLAFAIPSKIVYEITTELMTTSGSGNYGYVHGRTTVGATFADGIYSSGFFSPSYQIVYVQSINTNGSAYLAGLRRDDIITAVTVAGTKTTINNASQIDEIIEGLEIGDEIIFTVRRGSISAQEKDYSVVCEQYIYTI
ncbi:MAG: trypsin-like serine protease [Acholeplasmataceae bacterium]|nr:trypsin-like serine protease [Acholeplasmataceae bacterium]